MPVRFLQTRIGALSERAIVVIHKPKRYSGGEVETSRRVEYLAGSELRETFAELVDVDDFLEG
jgi:hypothetical protein